VALRLVLIAVLAALGSSCSGGESSEGTLAVDAAFQSEVDAGSDCQAESDEELCAQASRNCGELTRVDRCGRSRRVSCGTCSSGTCVMGQCKVQEECSADCAAGRLNACTCGAADPCNWSGDGVCDRECQEAFPSDHFDDGNDCLSIVESLGAGCSNNKECAHERTCQGGNCVCCDDAEEVNAQWLCHQTQVPAIAQDVCGTTRASNVANRYGADALSSVGVGCYSGSPNNHWCPPQLQCVSRVEADEYRCGCCAEVQGSFMCSYNVSFARTFCLGLDDSCLDGSCLPCIGDECQPECASNNDGICDEPEGTGRCPDGSDFSDCSD
jgi:hypothetical protein